MIHHNLSGLRVLIVEDEGIVAMYIEDVLTEIGCDIVATAARLEDALQKAEALEFDVAMLDVNLAGELSYPVAVALRHREIPFLFATGYGAVAIPQELEGAPLLTKPFRKLDLIQALTDATRPH